MATRARAGHSGLTTLAAVLLWAAGAVTLDAHGVSAADRAFMEQGGLTAFLYLGAKHMATGYDHIAFVLALLLLAESLREVAGLVTGFTIGHSLTLALAVLVAFSGHSTAAYDNKIHSVCSFSACT